MTIDLSGIIISGQRLEKLIHFLFEISDSVELVSYAYHEMTKAEYEAAKAEAKRLQKVLARANGLTDAEIDENEKSSLEEMVQQMDQLPQEIKDAIENDLRRMEMSFIQPKEIDAIVEAKFTGLGCTHRRVTCQTHCTLAEGGYVVYTFPTSDALKKLFMGMGQVAWPLKTRDKEFLADDPAFYRQGEKICSICSHESIIMLYLNEEQTRSFAELGIPYYFAETRYQEEKPAYPFSKETVNIFSTGSPVTRLLGEDIFSAHRAGCEKYVSFNQWFDEHQEELCEQTIPCRKTTREILKKLQESYELQPFHSEAIKRQCERHGWDAFFSNPIIGGVSSQTMPELDPFLYCLQYQGETLLVGGEHHSDYLFVDTMDAEEKLSELLVHLREAVWSLETCGELPKPSNLPKPSDLSKGKSNIEPVFQLMREINLYRGIDEYEKYDHTFLQTYLRTQRYEEFI